MERLRKLIIDFYKSKNLKRKKEIIGNSALFDPVYYQNKYPDAANSSLGLLEYYLLFGEKEGRRPNGYFSPKWYLSSYKGKMGREKSPLLHYIRIGEKMGLKPSEIFDPLWYLQSNPDVKRSGISPLAHFLHFGLLEKRMPNKNFNPYLIQNGLIPHEFYSEDNSDIYFEKFDKNSKSDLKIAVVVHAYYLEMIPKILSYLVNIPYSYDLFFTVSEDSSKSLEQILKEQEVTSYKIRVFPNQGYDIAPFLLLLDELKNKEYKLVCKIHTKKGPDHLEIYSHWFDAIMKPILGSQKIVGNIIKAFNSDKDLAVVGSADFYKSSQQLMYGNEELVKVLLTTLDKDLDSTDEWGFFAGTIFWARIDMFAPIINNPFFFQLIQKHMELEMKSGDPASIFHAIERVLGRLPSMIEMKTGISHQILGEETDYAIQVLPKDYNTPSVTGIHATLVDIVSR